MSKTLLLARLAQHRQLNAPWGLVVAPASFGRFGGDQPYELLANGRFAPPARTTRATGSSAR